MDTERGLHNQDNNLIKALLFLLLALVANFFLNNGMSALPTLATTNSLTGLPELHPSQPAISFPRAPAVKKEICQPAINSVRQERAPNEKNQIKLFFLQAMLRK